MKGAKDLLLVFLLIFATSTSSSSSIVYSESDDGDWNWQQLTTQNFSSQIRLHSHLLLLVSNPWSGESRSLMKELSDLVRVKGDEFGSLKLMYMHRNKEKLLADAVGATDEIITVVYYHYSFAYKYQGRLVASNILYSIAPYFTISPQEIPVKALDSEEEFRNFTESTDKAVILLEFCGWSSELIATMNKNRTENGDFSGVGFNEETVGISEARMKEKQKGTETAGPMCDTQHGFNGIPWIGEFSSLNDTVSFQVADTKDINSNSGLSSCSHEEFRKFDSFFSGFMSVAREFFLVPERYRFGLVSERSLLPSLGIQDSGSWSTMLYFNGCPSCSKVLEEGKDFKSILLQDESAVTKLEADGQDLDPAVPANRPSVILFVDRVSNLSEIKKKSKEALGSLRKLALNYQVSDHMGQQNGQKSERFYAQAFQEYQGVSGHPMLKLSPAAQKLKEKMSIMIVNEGKKVILDNLGSKVQGSSLHEILAHLLQKKKEEKLSSVAKEAGFQLLSDDIDIKLADTLQSEPTESIQVSAAPSEESTWSNSANPSKVYALDPNGISPTTGIGYSSQDDEEKRTYVDTRHLLSAITDELLSDDGTSISDSLTDIEKGSTKMDQSEESQFPLQSFKGSFYFSDGNYQLLRALTGESMIPSLVIVDPILQQHYVFPEQTEFSYASLEDVLHKFLDGVLTPYQRSESTPEDPREGTRPPFVNKDFHEADSIPHVTAHTFSEQVLGFNQSDDDNGFSAWKEDVVVLFSNSWCGFCQRMELVVREVFRALKGYMNMLKTGSWNEETMQTADNMKNANLKLPRIFLMDCTLNDCSLILNSTNQREVYPTLLIFPAERKIAVSYDGDMAVANIVKFIADHGSCSKHLTSDKGVHWSVAETGGRNYLKDALLSTFHKDAPIRKEKSYEVLLKNWTPKTTEKYSRFKSYISKRLPKTVAPLEVGSILVATERLTVQPFDNSMILIVKVDQNTRFKGLIYNKPIRWDSLEDMGKGFELLKDAPLSFGGPLVRRGMPLVALTRRAVKDQLPEVASGIYFLDQSATIHEIEQLKSGNQSQADYWFFLGFSSWGWEQLYDEIAEGSWNIVVNRTGLVEWP